MNFIVANRDGIGTIVILCLAAFTIYVGFEMKRRKEGKPTRFKAAIAFFGLLTIMAGVFIFAVDATKR